MLRGAAARRAGAPHRAGSRDSQGLEHRHRRKAQRLQLASRSWANRH